MRSTTLVPLLFLAACVDVETDPDPDQLAETEQEIIGGSLAADWVVARAVKPEKPCTGTLIASRYVLTALHCTAHNNKGEVVHFYTNASGFDSRLDREIVDVRIRPGTATPPLVTDDYYDINNQYSDIAILVLGSAAPSSSVPAMLEWAYPGVGVSGLVFGTGLHQPGTVGEVRTISNVTRTDDDDGIFWLEDDLGNNGDSGGAIYRFRKVFGVTHNGLRFTSVPEHLHWILGEIGYTWSGQPSVLGLYRYGTTVQSFDEATERMCQYACDQTRCEAYNYAASTGYCSLQQDVAGVVYTPAYRSGLK